MEQAEAAGIPVELVQGYRSPEEQTALYTSGKGVTKAPALSSFHNYGLAADLVPTRYLSLPNWNPDGPLWDQLGQIGERLGLTWGGRWGMPDKPHFEARWAPLSELKAYWEKFQKVMPIKIEPTSSAMIIIVLIGLAWYWLHPMLKRSGVL